MTKTIQEPLHTIERQVRWPRGQTEERTGENAFRLSHGHGYAHGVVDDRVVVMVNAVVLASKS